MANAPARNARKFVEITVNAARVIESWRGSVFSFEWLDGQGNIRAHEDMPITELEKRKNVEARLDKGDTLETPVLGIGVMDHVEIGSGKAVFLTLAALGHVTITVQVPEAARSDFESFID